MNNFKGLSYLMRGAILCSSLCLANGAARACTLPAPPSGYIWINGTYTDWADASPVIHYSETPTPEVIYSNSASNCSATSQSVTWTATYTYSESLNQSEEITRDSSISLSVGQTDIGNLGLTHAVKTSSGYGWTDSYNVQRTITLPTTIPACSGISVTLTRSDRTGVATRTVYTSWSCAYGYAAWWTVGTDGGICDQRTLTATGVLKPDLYTTSWSGFTPTCSPSSPCGC